MNTLDIKVPYVRSNGSQSLYSLKDVTDMGVYISGVNEFTPVSFMPEILEQVITILEAKQITKEQAAVIVYSDLSEVYGEEIADETFRWSNEFNDSYQTIKAMMDTGMVREAIRFMTKRDPIEGSVDNLKEALAQLIDEINGDNINVEGVGDEEDPEIKLDDVWNNW